MKNNIKKNFIYNVIGSLFYSFTSLFFLIVVTRINGVDEAGIFSFSFSFACLLFCIGNYATRTFQVTEKNKQISDYDYIYQRYFTSILMVIIAIIYSLINGYSKEKFIIIILLVIYKVIEAFSEVLYAVIQKKDELYKVGISMFLKGILGFSIFFIINILTSNLIISIVCLNIITFIIIIIYDINNIKKHEIEKKSFSLERLKLLFKIGFNPFIFTLLTLFMMNAQRYSIDRLLSNEMQTIFGIIVMPATIMMLASQFLIQPFLTTLSKEIKEKNIKKYKNLVLTLIAVIMIIGLLGSLLAWLIGIPFLELVYGIELSLYKLELVLILIGATLFATSYIISAAMTTIRKTKSQVVIFIISSIITLIISEYLVNKIEILGASYAYLITMGFLSISYIVVFLSIYLNLKKQHN